MGRQKSSQENKDTLSLGHRESVERTLSNLKEANSWYGSLGKLGRDFTRAATALGIKEKVNTSIITSSAHYASYDQQQGFINELTYGQDALENPATVFFLKTHETIHGLQAHKAAAFHVTAHNPNTRLILCPRDTIKLKELSEHDAYAKQIWICYNLQGKQAALEKALNGTPIHLSDFQNNISGNEESSLKSALRQSGKTAMTSLQLIEPGKETTLRDIYHNAALDSFYTACATRQADRPEESIQIVRLDDEDIIAIGNSFGPNLFTGDEGKLLDQYSEPLHFDSEDATQKYTTLNDLLSIEDENDLPTIKEALAQQGLTKESFMEQSMKKPLPFSL